MTDKSLLEIHRLYHSMFIRFNHMSRIPPLFVDNLKCDAKGIYLVSQANSEGKLCTIFVTYVPLAD